MGELKIVMPEEMEKKFRKLAMARFGYQKGSISLAAQKAIENWTNMNVEIEIKEKDSSLALNSLDKLKGIMKHVKKTSVELQHEAWNNIVKKDVNRL